MKAIHHVRQTRVRRAIVADELPGDEAEGVGPIEVGGEVRACVE